MLNRSPTISIKDITPDEAWNDIRPSVKYFRIFGCPAYMHIPDTQRKELDDKSKKCVFLGVSEESKAYRLYDPITRKIMANTDVNFDESNKWNWESKRRKSCTRM